jgi:hypothetical protein
MDSLHVHRERKFMNILELLHICNVSMKINLNDAYRDAYSPIFDVILRYEMRQRNYTTP